METGLYHILTPKPTLKTTLISSLSNTSDALPFKKILPPAASFESLNEKSPSSGSPESRRFKSFPKGTSSFPLISDSRLVDLFFLILQAFQSQS